MTAWLAKGRRRLGAVVLAIAVVVSAGVAYGYFSSIGTGSASAQVGALSAPSGLHATPGAGTVALSWQAVTPPGAGAVSYYVTRDGASPGGSCPVSSAPSAVTGCTDTGLAAGTYHYSVTTVWQSWTATTSSLSVTVSSGALDHFVVSTPGSQTAGAPFSETITAVDSAGHTVSSYSGSQAIVFSGPGTAPNGTSSPLYPSSVTFTGGVGVASVTLFKAQTTALTATQGSITGVSGSFSVGDSGAASFSVPTPPTPTAGTPFSETLTAVDAYGNTATSFSGAKTVSFSGPTQAPGGASPSYPSSVTFTGGVGTASITLVAAQSTAVLTASAGAVSGSSGTFAVNGGGASAFTVGNPGSQTAGTAFSETITAVDGYGNVATGYTGAKVLSFSGPATAPNGTSSPLYPGSVTFSGGAGSAQITLFKAQTTALTVTQGALSGVSSSFTVSDAGASAFQVSTPGTQAAGVQFSDTITAVDPYGNTATSYTGAHAIAFSGPGTAPGGAGPTYPGSVSFTAGVGSAQLTLVNAQTTALTATQGTVTGTSGSFVVNPTTAAGFKLSTPSGVVAGTAFNETVTAIDVYGNTATSYAGAQTVGFSGPNSSPQGNAPAYPASVTFTTGVGTASITLYDGQTTSLVAAQGSLNGSSAPFTVAGATASTFSVANPGPQTAGSAFTETITAIDSYGNTATSYTGAQTVTFSGPGTAPGGAGPSYPGSVSFTAGVATASITLVDAQTTTLTATQGTVAGTSTSFTVSAGNASAFRLSAPSGVVAGAAFNETVTAVDSYGNTATGYTGAQTVTFSGPGQAPSGASPSYPGSVTFTAGVGTASITLVAVQSSTALTAAVGAVNGSSGTFAVSPGTAAKLAITSLPVAGGTSATANLGPITVQEQDGYGNPSTTAVTVNLSSTGTTGEFAATQGGSSITSVNIPSGSSTTTFYYGNKTPGTPTFTVAGTGLTSASQQATISPVVGLGIVLTGGTGTPSLSCGTPSAANTCAITGVGQSGGASFYVTFLNSSGTQVVYSSSQASTITETGQNTGSVVIAAGATNSSPSTLTASHTGNAVKTSTLTFGSYTLTITVAS